MSDTTVQGGFITGEQAESPIASGGCCGAPAAGDASASCCGEPSGATTEAAATEAASGCCGEPASGSSCCG